MDRVGVDDSFFDLGGDSLSAMRLVAAINTSLNRRPSGARPVRGARRSPELAPASVSPRVRLEPLVAVERPAVIPLSFAQNRLWFLDQLQGPSPVYNMARGAAAPRALDAEALGAALADVVARHEILRTLFAAPDGIPRQVVVPPEQADFGWARRRRHRLVGCPADGGRRADGAPRLRPGGRDPVAGKAFPNLRPTSTCWWQSSHHIAADGWSIAPLVRDLGVAYASRCAGQAPGWAPLPVQYVDYTLWQRAQFGDLDDGDSRIAAQLAYWQDALAGMPERLQLPTDRPYPRGRRSARRERGGGLARRAAAAGARGGREHNATSFMVVQAALAVLLSKLSASSDVAVGFPIAGRTRSRARRAGRASSSTPWCCGSIWQGIPPSPRCWPRCGGAAWPPTNTRTCRSRCSSSGSTPPAP